MPWRHVVAEHARVVGEDRDQLLRVAQAAFHEAGGRRRAGRVDAEAQQRVLHEDVTPSRGGRSARTGRRPRSRRASRRSRPPARTRRAAPRSPRGAPSGRRPRTRRSCAWDAARRCARRNARVTRLPSMSISSKSRVGPARGRDRRRAGRPAPRGGADATDRPDRGRPGTPPRPGGRRRCAPPTARRWPAAARAAGTAPAAGRPSSSSEPSVEPSSTTISSQGGSDCASTLRTAPSRKRRPLKTGRMAVTRGCVRAGASRGTGARAPRAGPSTG